MDKELVRQGLEKTKAELAQREWLQGTLRNKNGGVCALGAIRYACGDGWHGWTTLSGQVEHCLNKQAMQYGIEETVPHLKPIAHYNDFIAKSKEDVIMLVDKAIADL